MGRKKAIKPNEKMPGVCNESSVNTKSTSRKSKERVTISLNSKKSMKTQKIQKAFNNLKKGTERGSSKKVTPTRTRSTSDKSNSHVTLRSSRQTESKACDIVANISKQSTSRSNKRPAKTSVEKANVTNDESNNEDHKKQYTAERNQKNARNTSAREVPSRKSKSRIAFPNASSSSNTPSKNETPQSVPTDLFSVKSGKKSSRNTPTTSNTRRNLRKQVNSVEMKSEVEKAGPVDTNTSDIPKRSSTSNKATKVANSQAVHKEAPERKRKNNSVAMKHDKSMEMPAPRAEDTSLVQTESKRRKVSLSSDTNKSRANQRSQKKSIGAKMKNSNADEDPYDFEAYLSNFDVVGKKTKKRRPRKPQEKMEGGRALTQNPVIGTTNSRRLKSHAHLFFIQPCKPRKKGSSTAVEEPSPSIIDEIAEYNLQPPLVTEELSPGPRIPPIMAPKLQPKEATLAISTPRGNPSSDRPLNATPGFALSPIQAEVSGSAIDTQTGASSFESRVPSGGAVLVESSRNNSQLQQGRTSSGDNKIVDTSWKQDSKSSALSGDEVSGQSSNSRGKAHRKSVKEKAKDEFESWLAKFNQELSDIESFQLSIERSQ